MNDKTRHELALRVITVSGRQALRQARDAEERELLAGRIHELLAELEQQVIRNGAAQDVLAAIERERRRVWE